tara:strand:- start:10696 stop:11151 length:456 start_codon:yes stop_codon:yes gene_type:complete
MATYNDGKGYNLGTGTAHVAAGINKVSSVTVDLNFATITTERAAAGLTALTSADILEVIKVPAQTLVTHVALEVTTAEGGTLTVDVGDGDNTDGYLDGVNANATAAYLTVAGTDAYEAGKYYTAADTIDIVLNNAADAAVMKLTAVMVDCS